MLEDVETADFVTTINVLRRVVANLGGNSDLPEGVVDPPVACISGASAPTVRTPRAEPTPLE
jgi:hypothetical protein